MNSRMRQRLNHKKLFKKNKLWNLNYTLAEIIYSSVYQFKHMKRNRFPGRGEADTPEKWENILDEIIWAYKETAGYYSNSPTGIEHNKLSKEKYPDGITFDDLFDKYTDEYKGLGIEISEQTELLTKEYYERIKNGKRLFYKYFDDLWD
jgi:hypothetical protein